MLELKALKIKTDTNGWWETKLWGKDPIPTWSLPGQLQRIFNN